jgi:O-antigen/teichoic acid export membrane protein
MWSFIKQFLIYGFSGILGKIAAVFLIPLYTHALSKEEYGAMAIIISCKGIIDLFSNLNIHSGIFRDFFEKNVERNKLVSTGFFSILFISTIIFITLLLSRSFWINTVLEIPNVYENAFIVMLLSIPFGSAVSFLSILTRYQKKPITFSIITISQLLIQIGVTVICVLQFKIGIIGYFWGVLSGEFFSIISLFIINRSFFSFTWDRSILKKALIFSIPTLPAVLADWLDSSMGQVLIGKYVSLSDLGSYSLALQLASVFTLICTAIRLVWSPFLYENYKDTHFNQLLSKIFKAIVWLIIIVTINLSFLSREIILLLSNEAYLDASIYFILLCFPMGLLLLQPFAESGILISRQTKYLGLFSIISSTINLLIMLFFLPKFGIFIVPLSLSVSKLLRYVLTYSYSSRTNKLFLPNKMIFFFLIVVLICLLVSFLGIDNKFKLLILVFIDLILFFFINTKYNCIKRTVAFLNAKKKQS